MRRSSRGIAAHAIGAPRGRAGRAAAAGFTLVEMVLAVVIGSLLIAACVGVFGATRRADNKLAGRFKQSTELGRVQATVRRAMGSLVMSLESPAATEGGAQQGAAGGAASGAAATGKPAEPPRFVLEPDGYLGMRTAGNVQRLEVVLTRSPLPPPRGMPTEGLVSGDAAALRGAFELRPDLPDVKPTPGTDKTGWTLWWRPLPTATADSTEEDITEPRAIDPSQTPGAIPLATGLVKAEWKAFKQRQWSTGIAATNSVDLPAYVTLAVETTTGLKADWMFELAWANGPEVIEEEQPIDLQIDGGQLTLGGVGSDGSTVNFTVQLDLGGGGGGGGGDKGLQLRFDRGGATQSAPALRAGPRNRTGAAFPGRGGFATGFRGAGGGGNRGTGGAGAQTGGGGK